MTGSEAHDASDLRTVGDRIEVLLDELRACLDQREWERVEEVIALVTDLYGGGLERTLQLADDDSRQRLLADDLVASLLILHGLHPEDLEARVHAALDSVRPYMESHGGDAEVLGIDEGEGVLHLRLMGTCDGCPSSSVTLQHAVRQALDELAPEIVHIDVVDDTAQDPAPVIPIGLTQKPVAAG